MTPDDRLVRRATDLMYSSALLAKNAGLMCFAGL